MPYEVMIRVYCTDDTIETDDQYPDICDGIATEREAREYAEAQIAFFLSPDGIEEIQNTCPQTAYATEMVVERIEARIRRYEEVETISQ